MALSLSFDDARVSQLETGIPILNEFGIRGSFYLSPKIAEPRLAEWRKAMAAGHEIGNHTMTHPCSGCYGFARENALEDYDLKQMAADIDSASNWIIDHLGAPPRTFAYPCGQTYVGRGASNRSYVPLVAERFLAGRCFNHPVPADPWHLDLAQPWSHDADRLRPGPAIALLEQGLKDGLWIVLTGHDIAPDHLQGIAPDTLQAICQWVRDKGDPVWVDTVAAVAHHIKINQSRKC
jgi:peptidoglycan/xylan/chitin deacetylase (PgdA/CDA1 family)